jgi:hypothetical protein
MQMRPMRAPMVSDGGSGSAPLRGLEVQKQQVERCGQCKAGDHSQHTDTAGRCVNDNAFNADCKCPEVG